MIDIGVWMDGFIKALNTTFGKRVLFIGLQGSRGRGEATEASDIDTVVILDELLACDIETYNAMLDTLPHRELICGFISGKSQLLNWEPSDLFQFYFDTKPIKGKLDEIMPPFDDEIVNRAVKIAVCNIYHGCVHNMLYEKSEDILKGLYKCASFAVQAIYYKQTGEYVCLQKDLLNLVSPDERVIVDTYMSLKNGEKADFRRMSEYLFAWSKGWIDKT